MPDPALRLNAALSGRYRIERQLGEGGMATVYLADDLRHERKVALKVLKPELAAVVGAERFLAEIKTTANLQHPHILPLFDSGEADNFLFYVMPFVEGESLRERLDREHQLPVDEAVQIAKNVAEALEYAHSHGVIHRDIKPANILLQAGKSVVSDFGIALAVGTAGGGRLTETGLSLGTPHYMSPEQATGDSSVGAATDIYALGCVLYEMLVGEPPFTGSTPQAVLGKIVTGEAEPVTRHRRSVPANVDGAIRKALEKVPADRFGGASEFVSALVDPRFRHAEVASSGVSGGARRVAMAGWGSAVALLMLLGIVLSRPDTAREEATWLNLNPPPGVTFGTDAHRGFAVSPDGRTVVFADGATGTLYRRELSQPASVEIPVEVTAWYPFFSPDGGWLGFFDQASNELMKVRLDGAQLQSLAPFGGAGRYADWSPDGTIVVHASVLDTLVRVSETGGDVVVLPGTQGPNLGYIDLLPGGQTLLAAVPRGEGGIVTVVSLETGERKELFPGTTPRYVPSGHIIFWNQGALWAIQFDADRTEVIGNPVQIVQGVWGDANLFARFSAAGDVLVYQGAGNGREGSGLTVVHRDGTEESLGVPPGEYEWPRLSPDGSRLAVVRGGEQRDVWIYDFVSASLSPFTFDLADDFSPIWTPDGQRLVFASSRGGAANLFWRRADGTDEAQRLTTSENTQWPNGWTPEGDLVYTELAPGRGFDLYTVSPSVDAPPTLLAGEPFSERNAAMSPDGRWIAYESWQLGHPEIFVRSFPDMRGEWILSSIEVAPESALRSGNPGEGRHPLWSRNGRELFYRNQGVMLRVPVETGQAFTHGTPEVLFTAPYDSRATGPHYDLMDNNEDFIINFGRYEGSAPSEHALVVVTGLSALLKDLLPD